MASVGGEEDVRSGGTVERPAAPLVAPSLRVVAEELGVLVDGDRSDSDSDVNMESSPLRAAAVRRLGRSGMRSFRTGESASVVLFPAVPLLGVAEGCPVHEETVPDSADGGELVLDDDLIGIFDSELDDPACGGGSRAGRCECSYEAELVHLNRKVRRLGYGGLVVQNRQKSFSHQIWLVRAFYHL